MRWSDSQQRCQRRDAEVHQDARAELSMEQDGDGRSVGISVRYGVVSLTGLVESYARKCAIDHAVGRIVGVKDLRDYLHVRPSADAAPDDGQIEQTANRAPFMDLLPLVCYRCRYRPHAFPITRSPAEP